MKTTYQTRKTWAEDDMKFFHDLAKYFYRVDDSAGYFLDIGANIGTTGIYFTKKLAPNLKLLAFEPDPENFKLLRANLILNDIEDKTIAANCGLGVSDSEQNFYKSTYNPGMNGMFTNMLDNSAPKERIRVTSLDNFFHQHKLNPDAIKYIWIDTEGFEPQVLIGAKNILRQNPAPIFMEFNPHFWQNSGFYTKLVEILKEFYAGYIWIQDSIKTQEASVQPIEKLLEYRNVTRQLGDIFLIRKK